MGTVGISFGNPTSGQGFNVSSTVSQILANLQAVETPWQTQLSSLDAQDSALTSIGSDLSTLTSALQNLTDFQGVLSGKLGSSSDSTVLQISSAATSSVSGTHTVVVNKLAESSSFASDSLAGTDTLSGTFTLAVGSGSTQTITINSSDNTLTTLAATINSGSYGVTANVVTASNGTQQLSLVSQTSGTGGNLTIGGALTDSTTGSTVNFTQVQAGQDADLTVDGVDVTSSSNTVTNAIQGVTLQLLNQSPNGEKVQVVITNDNSAVESAVSSFVSSYNQVIGDLNQQETNNASGNPEPLFGTAALASLQEDIEAALNFVQPQNAVGTTTAIGNTDTLSSGSLSIQVGSGSAQNVNFSGGTLSDLADAINSAGVGVTASIITSGSSVTLSLTNSTSGSNGVITVNPGSLTDTTTGDQVNFGTSTSSGITSLTQLGITASTSDDGTLSLNTDTLDSALNSNYQAVVNFLQPSGEFTTFGGNLTNVLDNLGSGTTDGVISLALAQNSSQESQLNTNISTENTYISSQQALLTSELNTANQTLEQIPEQVNEVNELYSAISGFNENPQG
jgi:flagellar hook-associated protein 2